MLGCDSSTFQRKVIDMSTMAAGMRDNEWRKSSRSINNGACVEAALSLGEIMIRDSADRDGPVVHCPAKAWRAFVAEVKSAGIES
jgi:hypothetical protein